VKVPLPHTAHGLYMLALALAVWAASPALGQQCPQASAAGTPSRIRTLEGALIFHDGLREWFELKLDQPQCGQVSIELVRGERTRTSLEVLRGCRIRSRGAIASSPSGYYSLDMFQTVEEVESVGACVQQLPFPDYSKAKPDKSVHEYRVDMHVDYGAGDHPILLSVSNAGGELRPWQAYADYLLTGGLVLYGFCAKGFVVDKVFGTPQASPSHSYEPRTSDDMAKFDPESAAAAGKKDLHLGYTCVRNP